MVQFRIGHRCWRCDGVDSGVGTSCLSFEDGDAWYDDRVVSFCFCA